MEERRDVYYSGTVQGVGFASQPSGPRRVFSITGFVRNEPDGRVRVLVEGKSSEIDAFLFSLEREMARFIRDAKCDKCEATGRFKSFDIAY